MAIAIDEVTAEVAPPEGRASGAQPAGAQSSSATDQRRQREQIERMQQRAARVRAD
jgi:hypothetical protein